MYDINDLLLFVKVVEIGSFLHTAKLLKVSQPTIARKIKNLEEQLEVTLLHVTTREFEVTEIGKQVYNLIKQQYSAVGDLFNDLEQITKTKNEPHGTVKIALPMIMAMNSISPHLPKLLLQYPKINLVVHYISQEIDLIKGGYDIAILSYIPNQLSLKIKHIFTSRMKLYCTKEYSEKYGVPKTPEELSNHMVTGYILLDETIPYKIPLTNIDTGENTIIDMPKRIVISSALHSLKILFSNEVICAMYDDIDPILNSESIVKVLPEFHSHLIKYYMVRHPQGNDVKTQIVYDFLQKCLTPHPSNFN